MALSRKGRRNLSALFGKIGADWPFFQEFHPPVTVRFNAGFLVIT